MRNVSMLNTKTHTESGEPAVVGEKIKTEIVIIPHNSFQPPSMFLLPPSSK